MTNTEPVNSKYTLEIEILTPVSIGAGAEKDLIRGVDFVVKDNKIYRLNIRKLFANGISAEDLSSYFAGKNETGLIAKIGGKLANVSDYVTDLPVPSTNDIKSFIRNQLSGNPIIPGSSIKGAIRSVLYEYLGGTTKTGKEVFGDSNKGDEFMRFIKFSDAEFTGVKLINTKIFNLYSENGFKGGWKHERNNGTNASFRTTGFNTIYEVLAPKEKSVCTIALSEKQYSKISNHINDSEKRQIVDKINGLSKLFEITNQHSKKYIQKEIAFFNKYSNDKTSLIIQSLENVLRSIPDNNSACVFKMSAGAGFHSITGDWQFDDFSIDSVDGSKRVSRGMYRNKPSAKSRKIAIDQQQNFMPMGFVKLSLISDEILKERAEKLALELEAKKQAEIEKQKEREAETERERLRQEEARKPVLRTFETLKDGDIVDAMYLGQDGSQAKVKLFTNPETNSSFRYAGGFEPDSILELKISFPNKKNRSQFKLDFHRIKS